MIEVNTGFVVDWHVFRLWYHVHLPKGAFQEFALYSKT